MISIIICLIGFCIAGFIFYKNMSKSIGKSLPLPIVIVIAAISISLVQPFGIQRIDAGNVGLKIARIGNDKGIPVAVPVKGWVVYNSWVNDVLEYSIRQEHVSYSDITVTTKGGMDMEVNPSFNYALKPEKAADVYIHLLKGADFEVLKETWIKTATLIAMKNASNDFAIDSVFNHQSVYQKAVEAELNVEMGDYFEVTQINPGQVTPPQMSQILQKKAQQIQEAQQAELAKTTAIAEAQTKIAIAKGDSAQAVIAASGRAEAIKREQLNITTMYIEYIKASNWDGKLPTTMLGSSSNVMFSR